jgi:hypothetical protein
MKGQDSIGHLENEIHFQRGAGLKALFILRDFTARPEAAPSRDGC